MSVYLDHASTTPLCGEAKEAMREAMDCIGNPSSMHGAGTAARALLEQSRKAVADCLGCEKNELIFVSGGTEANALALHGRTRVAVSAVEHASVLQNARGAAIIPVLQDGTVDLQAAEEHIANTDFVSVQYANNELGTLQPIKELGILCKHAVFHTDAVQAVGHVPIDLRKEPFDLLSLSAHKFGGPAGIGALYVKNGTPLFPLMRGGMQERGRRAGTESVLLACGMSAALQTSVQSMEREAKRLQALKTEAIARFKALGGIPWEHTPSLASHVHVRFPGRDAEALLYALDLHGICVSAGAACHAVSQEPSHVLTAVGMTVQEAKSALRISMGRTTAQSDLDALFDALKLILKQKTSS